MAAHSCPYTLEEVKTEKPISLTESKQIIETGPQELVPNIIEAPSMDPEVNPQRHVSQSSEKRPSSPVQYNCVLCTACYVTKEELKVHFVGHKDSIPEGLKKAYRKSSIQEPKVLDIQAARKIAKQIEDKSSNAEIMLKKTEEGKYKRNVEENPNPMIEPRVIDIRNIKQVAKEIEDKVALKQTSTNPQTKTVSESNEQSAAMQHNSLFKENHLRAKPDTYSCSLFKFKCNGHATLKDHISDTIQ